MRLKGARLALDVGDRRIGVAVSDPTGLVARALTVLPRRSRQEDFERLARLAREHQAVEVIVGLPVHMDGAESEQSRRVRRFVSRMEAAFRAQELDIPIIFSDERLSTTAATQHLEALSQRRRKRHPGLDAEAAAVILQEYLEQSEQ